MSITHILIGGIGTLVETSQMQLDAFNAAFKHNEIDYVWTRNAYAKSLESSGGKNRLAAIKLSDGSHLTDSQIAKVHADKTRIYGQMMREEGLALRDGTATLFERAKDRDIALVWATTTSQDNINAILEATGDKLTADMFAHISNGQSVKAPKPDAQIYTSLISDHDIDPAHAIVIEDSPTGVAAGKAAGLHTIAYPGDMHSDHDYSHADKIVSSLDEIEL